MTSAPLALPAGRIVAGRHAVKAHVLYAHGVGRHLALTEPNQETLLDVLACDGGAPEAALAVLEDTRVRLADVPSRLVVAHAEHGVDTGLVWAAAPWPAAPPLSELVALCALTPAEAVELAHALAASLDAAHAKGVLHLALDASCVHVPPLAKGVVAVVEFGLARACAATGGRPWSDGDAPELVARGLGAASPASDVHGAAGVLLQAVTGAKDVREAERRATEILPTAMLEVLARARSADPQARYASVGRLAEAFAEALEGKRPTSQTMPVPAPASSPAPLAPVPTPMPAMPVPMTVAPVPTPMPVPPPAMPEPPPPPPSGRAFVSTSPFAVSSDPLASGPLPEVEAVPEDVLVTRPRRTGVVVAASIVGVLGVAAAAVFVVTNAASSRKPTSVVAAATPAPPASASVAAAAPVEPPTAPTASSPSSSPASSASSAPSPLGPKEAELTVVCTPACETVLLNGKPLASYPEPARLAPGTYGVGVSRAGHGGQWKKVVLRAGARETLAFTLTPQATPAAAPAARPKKDCGKFLKRCD